MVQYAMTANLPEFITKASEEWFRQPMLASLKREGLTAEWYYTTSTDIADKKVSRVLAFGLASLFMAGLAIRAITTGA